MRRAAVAVLRVQCRSRPLSGLAMPTRVMLSASQPPTSTPTPPSSTSTASGTSATNDPFDPQSIATEFKVDAKAAEQMRVAEAIGEEAFEENTAILQKLAMRGLRAFLIAAVGIGAFAVARKRKNRQEEQESDGAGEPGKAVDSASPDASVDTENDPTQRYLEEMRGLGFDVDTLEEELATEKATKNKKAGPKIA